MTAGARTGDRQVHVRVDRPRRRVESSQVAAVLAVDRGEVSPDVHLPVVEDHVLHSIVDAGVEAGLLIAGRGIEQREVLGVLSVDRVERATDVDRVAVRPGLDRVHASVHLREEGRIDLTGRCVEREEVGDVVDLPTAGVLHLGELTTDVDLVPDLCDPLDVITGMLRIDDVGREVDRVVGDHHALGGLDGARRSGEARQEGDRRSDGDERNR